MRVTWIPGVLRAAGLDVYELPGWQGRGRSISTIKGLVGHDTVTTKSWSDARVDALLRDGRPGVPGPLSQTGMDRTGRWRMIADGRCHHNGYGYWGNDAIGCEVFAAGGLKGQQEPWNAAQRESFIRGAAAILAYLNLNPVDHLRGHKETDPRRKVDPYGVDMAQVRAQVAAVMAGGQPIEEDEVKTEDIKAIADAVFAQIAAKGLSPRTKDDIAKRVWMADVHGKPARNRLHDCDVKASQIRKEVASHAEDVTPPDPPEEQPDEEPAA